jgi:cell wall assembly regulator SMI1
MPDLGRCASELGDRLAALWRAQGAPIAQHLAPGLTSAELDGYERSSGLTLPAELRQWWGWHNGVNRAVPGTLPVTSFDGNILFVPCDPVQPATVHRWAREPDDPDTPRAESWTAVVAAFAELIEEGHFIYSAADGRWLDQHKPVPEAYARLV